MTSETPKPTKQSTDPSEPAGFDKILERLRAIVERLEGGKLTLEQSLEAFEEGVRLSRRGAEVLDRAERRVEILTQGEGAMTARPFEEDPEPSSARLRGPDSG